MRVLVLAPKYFGLGGAQAYTRMFAEAVEAAGAEVEILSLANGDLVDRTCPGRYLGHQGHDYSLWAQARFLTNAVRRGPRYDLVLCGSVGLAPIGHILCRLFRVPYVVIGYGLDVWKELRPPRREALRRAARVVAISHFTAHMVAAVQGVSTERVTVVHPAVDPVLLAYARDARAAPQPQNGVTFLTVSRLSGGDQYKGCDTVIDALPAVRAAAGPARYVIVGDGDDRQRLEMRARERGVAEGVTFAGQVPQARLAAYYQACDVFVMPSVVERRGDGWTGEGFGIVYIEAAAFGRPVVASPDGGVPEAVDDGVTGLLVDGRDVDAVAGALINLARDDGLRERLGAAGERWVQERFTVERFRREVEAVIGVAVGAAV